MISGTITFFAPYCTPERHRYESKAERRLIIMRRMLKQQSGFSYTILPDDPDRPPSEPMPPFAIDRIVNDFVQHFKTE